MTDAEILVAVEAVAREPVFPEMASLSPEVPA